MFYLELCLLIVVGVELVTLWQKGLKKTTIKLAFYTLINLLINSIVLIPSMTKRYSSTIYILNGMENNPFLILIWVGISVLYLFLLWKILLKVTKKKKQNKTLTILLLIISVLNILGFILLLFHNIAPWLIFLACLASLGFLVKDFIKRHKNYSLFILIILCTFTYYSFFTNTGAARLNIALMGYPIAAYQTGLEDLKYLKEKNIRKYYPLKSIPVESGDMGIILVKNHLGIKIGKYYGF